MVGRVRAAALAVVVGASLGTVVVGTDGTAAAGRPPRPPRPVVTKLAPRTGPPGGGTVVTIKGKHLKTAKKVLFGSTKGTRLKVRSDRKLTVVAPAHAAGVVHVTVRTRGGRSATGPKNTFTYALVRPHVTGLAPASGPDIGGTRVTVTGTGFDAVSGVTFGDVPGAAVAVASSTRLTVTSPEGVPGKVHVHVTNAAGTSRDEGGDTFTFSAVPRAVRAPLPPDADASPDVSLAAVSCPGRRQCFAVGDYLAAGGVRRPLVERSTAAVAWTAASPVLPGDADPAYGARLVDLDCVSTSFCVAVGTYKTAIGGIFRPLVETWNASTWTPQAVSLPTLPVNGNTVAALVEDVDCPSSTSCVAVGHYRDLLTNDVPLVLSLTGGSWSSLTTPLGPDTSGARLHAVDCVSELSCWAVGGQHVTVGPADQGYLATGAGTGWIAGPAPLPGDGASPDPHVQLANVACDGQSGCVAAGSYTTSAAVRQGFLVLSSPALQAVPVLAPLADAGSQPALAFHDVSCAVTCVAVGDYTATDGGQRPVLVTTLGALVQVVTGPLPADARTGPTVAHTSAVACASQNICLAGGSYDTATQQLPVISARSNAGWAARSGAVPADFLQDAETAALTYDTGVGVAVGAYGDTSGHTQGLILVDLS